MSISTTRTDTDCDEPTNVQSCGLAVATQSSRNGAFQMHRKRANTVLSPGLSTRSSDLNQIVQRISNILIDLLGYRHTSL